MTALVYAQTHGHTPILELLQNNTHGRQPNVGIDNDSHVLWAALGEISAHFSQLAGAARYFGMSESDIPLYVACTLAQRDAPSTDFGRFIDQRFLEAAAPVLERVNRQIAAVRADSNGLSILLREFCSYADSNLKAHDKSLRWQEFVDWAERDA
jgi:hypothetical protein